MHQVPDPIDGPALERTKLAVTRDPPSTTVPGVAERVKDRVRLSSTVGTTTLITSSIAVVIAAETPKGVLDATEMAPVAAEILENASTVLLLSPVGTVYIFHLKSSVKYE